MRFWVILLTVSSLLMLPFSGSSATDVELNMAHTAHSEAEQPHSDETNESAEAPAHCDMSEPSDAAAQMSDDCCEDSQDCGSCPPDCGHCAASGHGCSAVLNTLQPAAAATIFMPVMAPHSFYQLLNGQPTPPPIIA